MLRARSILYWKNEFTVLNMWTVVDYTEPYGRSSRSQFLDKQGQNERVISDIEKKASTLTETVLHFFNVIPFNPEADFNGNLTVCAPLHSTACDMH